MVPPLIKPLAPSEAPRDAKALAAGLIFLAAAGDDAGQICRAAGVQDALGQGKPGPGSHGSPRVDVQFWGFPKQMARDGKLK